MSVWVSHSSLVGSCQMWRHHFLTIEVALLHLPRLELGEARFLGGHTVMRVAGSVGSKTRNLAAAAGLTQFSACEAHDFFENNDAYE